MKRKALLIAGSNCDSDYPLPGTAVDLVTLKNFLISEEGGAWEDDEITAVDNTDPIYLRAVLDGFAGADYGFVFFSGHGEHQVGGGMEETHVLIAENLTWAVKNLRPSSSRYTLVVDSCRQLRQITETLRKFAAANARAILESTERPIYREAFDGAVLSCAAGGIEVYSCSPGEASFETDRGGEFTRALVHESRSWANEGGLSKLSILTVKAAVEKAQTALRVNNIGQSPVCHLGRRRDCFPFAIHR